MGIGNFLYSKLPELLSGIRQLTSISTVHSRGLTFKLLSDNWITKYRTRTFNEKEPEMLNWIDEKLHDRDVFFDVGANVGIYSIYAAMRNRNSQIIAFEPEYSNLHQLKQNILNNQLANNIVPYSIAFNDKSGLSYLHLQDETPGAALSTVSDEELSETDTGHNVVWKEGIAVMSLDEFCDQVGIQPTMIKIDVDGNELSILKGGAKTFMNSKLRSVFIEVDTSKLEYSRVLDNYGFKLNRKQKNENDRFENQVWEKSESL